MKKETEHYGTSYIEHNHPFLKALLQDMIPELKKLTKVTSEAYESIRPLPELANTIETIQKQHHQIEEKLLEIGKLYDNFAQVLTKTNEMFKRQEKMESELVKLHSKSIGMEAKLRIFQDKLKKKVKKSECF